MIRGLSKPWEATFSAEMNTLSQEQIDALLGTPEPEEVVGYSIVAETPVDVMVRWHRKAKVRKKWLKRFGTKQENITVEMSVSFVDSDIDADDRYITTMNLHADPASVRIYYKPHQLRNGYIVSNPWAGVQRL